MRNRFKKITRTLGSSLLIFLFPAIGFTQEKPYDEVTVASPEAASLGKYTDIPVNYHTGVPSIDIPIYTVREGPISLPISLSYHASGLRVLEAASWVGAGWSLNAGGVITRTVNGGPDEKNTGLNNGHTHGHYTDKGFSHYLPENNTQEWGFVQQGKKDGEPDMYSFNFAGYMGKFYFRDDQTVEIVGKSQDLHIHPEIAPSQSFVRFIVTTPDGMKYHFGRTPSGTDTDAVEITKPLSPLSGITQGDVISSWYLYKVESPNGGYNITLEYEPVSYGYYTLSMYPISPQLQLGSFGNPPGVTSEYLIMKNITNGVRLSQISFTNGSVDFLQEATSREDLCGPFPDFIEDSNTGQNAAKALGKIQISGNNGFCKEFELGHSYFEDNTTSLQGNYSSWTLNTDRKRLKLNQITERSCDGSEVVPPYVFSYYNELVPRRLTFAHDHWGYFNGAVGNTQLIPTYFKDGVEETGANRDSSYPAMRGGALHRIAYPTGAITTYDLEANTTWVSMGTSSKANIMNLAAGADGNNVFVTGNMISVGREYEINLSNNGNTPGAAILEIKQGSTLIDSYYLVPDQTLKENVYLPSGTIDFHLREDNTSTADLAEVVVFEWTSTVTSTPVDVGGLRIKRITQYDGMDPDNSIVTDYTYTETSSQGESDVSSGQLFSRPVYVEVVRNELQARVGYPFTEPTLGEAMGCLAAWGTMPYYESPSPIRPMETTQGNHIGYRKVKVAQTGNGYTIYEYHGQATFTGQTSGDIVQRTFDTNCDPSIPNFPTAPLANQPLRGQLKRKSVYSESGQRLLTESYLYDYENENEGVPGFIARSFGDRMLGTFYTLLNYRLNRKDVVQIHYDDSGTPRTIFNTEYFASDRHPQVTSNETSTSSGDIRSTTFKYAKDFVGCTNYINTISACDVSLSTALQTATVAYSADLSLCTTQACRHQAWQDWRAAQQAARVTYVACRQSGASAYNTCLEGLPDNIVYDLQIAHRNPILETGQFQQNELLNAQYNQYEKLSSTVINPVNVHQVNVASPSSFFAGATVNGTNVTLDGRYEIETTVKFDKDDLVEILGRDGVAISYLYNATSKLPVVKAIGVGQQTLLSASLAVANIEDLRTYPTTAHGQITTYHYDEPLEGLSEMVDVNGIKTTYEYDALGRLIFVKDHDGNVLQQTTYTYNLNP